MFDCQVNLITGDRKSGRSTFLLILSEHLHKSGTKVYFIGATHEFQSETKILKDFSGFDFFSSSDSNNFLIVDKIQELLTRQNFTILVDDVDYLSDKLIKKIIQLPTKKILTCLSSKKDTFEIDFQLYEMINYFDNKVMKTIQTLSNNGNTYLVDDIFRSFNRNEKINTILDDKGG